MTKSIAARRAYLFRFWRRGLRKLGYNLDRQSPGFVVSGHGLQYFTMHPGKLLRGGLAR